MGQSFFKSHFNMLQSSKLLFCYLINNNKKKALD